MARAAALAPTDFFSGLRKGVKSKLAGDLKGFETSRGHSRLLKLHYGRPEFHFEAWHHTGDGRLEIGLHFEGRPEANQDAFDYFRERMVEVKAHLPHAELEPWDRGWTRLYETVAALQLDEAVLPVAVDRLDAYITTLQPMLAAYLELGR